MQNAPRKLETAFGGRLYVAGEAGMSKNIKEFLNSFFEIRMLY